MSIKKISAFVQHHWYELRQPACARVMEPHVHTGKMEEFIRQCILDETALLRDEADRERENASEARRQMNRARGVAAKLRRILKDPAIAEIIYAMPEKRKEELRALGVRTVRPSESRVY